MTTCPAEVHGGLESTDAAFLADEAPRSAFCLISPYYPAAWIGSVPDKNVKGRRNSLLVVVRIDTKVVRIRI
ncbi:hypothetical protein CEXT_666361 [Caerostris extrusa]|uniref:Uncharacterized protein n=1 Tax=Caerostris extrusa TaxID=172846 RepID=A0AAV4MVR5_CAEEX|nr:hypothetical protein CEXT_666361 [Caerostris extrusa]